MKVIIGIFRFDAEFISQILDQKIIINVIIQVLTEQFYAILSTLANLVDNGRHVIKIRELSY